MGNNKLEGREAQLFSCKVIVSNRLPLASRTQPQKRALRLPSWEFERFNIKVGKRVCLGSASFRNAVSSIGMLLEVIMTDRTALKRRGLLQYGRPLPRNPTRSHSHSVPCRSFLQPSK